MPENFISRQHAVFHIFKFKHNHRRNNGWKVGGDLTWGVRRTLSFSVSSPSPVVAPPMFHPFCSLCFFPFPLNLARRSEGALLSGHPKMAKGERGPDTLGPHDLQRWRDTSHRSCGVVARPSAHRGKWGQLTLPWKNGWKIKKRKHAKWAVFYVSVIFWEQSGQADVENGAMLTTYLFRMHILIVKFSNFSSPQAASGHWPP